MSQVIIIHDSKPFIDILQNNVNTYLGIDIIPLSTEEAIKLIDILPQIDMIIVKSKIGRENTALNIVNHIKNTQVNPVIIVIGTPDNLIKDVTLNVNDNDWQSIIAIGKKALKIDDLKLKERPRNKYIPISCEYFLPLTTTPCDIFIRIKKSNSDFQFVKRFKANDTYNREEVQKYIKRGIRHFYIPIDFKDVFNNLISNQLTSKLENSSEDTSTHEQITLLEESFKIAHLLIKDSGFVTSTIQLVDGVVGAMLNSIKKVAKNHLAMMLSVILEERDSFAFRHAFLTALIASNTLEATFHSKWTEDQKRILSFVAFFHDLMLVERKDLMTIYTNDQLEKANLSPADKTLIMNHAKDAANLCLEYPNYPTNADTIIKEHHLANDGIGFNSSDFNHVIHPLSIVFNVSEKFTLEIINHYEDNKTFFANQVLEKMKEDQNNDRLLNVIQALRSRIIGQSK